MALVDGGFVLVVGAGLQSAAAHAADIAVGLDGVDENIVGVIVVVHAEAAAHDAVAGGAAGQEDLDHVIELHAFGLEGFVELAGLFHVAGEAVEQPALVALILEDVEHHGDGDFVGHEFALVDIGLGLHAQFGAAADMLTENSTGLDVGDAVLFHEKSALGALAAAIGAKNQNIHRILLRRSRFRRAYRYARLRGAGRKPAQNGFHRPQG